MSKNEQEKQASLSRALLQPAPTSRENSISSIEADLVQWHCERTQHVGPVSSDPTALIVAVMEGSHAELTITQARCTRQERECNVGREHEVNARAARDIITSETSCDHRMLSIHGCPPRQCEHRLQAVCRLMLLVLGDVALGSIA